MYNQVYLIGRLTTDPEIKELETSKKVCNITLAVSRSYKNNDGVYETDFIKCTLWDVIASRVTEYCKKGDLISVRGQLRNNIYTDDNNQKRYTNEVIVEKLAFLNTSKKENEDIIVEE